MSFLLRGIIVLWFAILSATVYSQHSKKIIYDVYLIRSGQHLTFGNSRLQLVFSVTTGNLLQLQSSGNTPYVSTGNKPSTDVIIAGSRVGEKAPIRYISHSFITDTAQARVTLKISQQMSEGKYLLITSYMLYSDRTLVDRSMAITSGKNVNPEKLEGFSFSWPALRVGHPKDCEINVPGPFWPFNFTPAGTPYDSLALQKKRSYHNAPDGSFGIFSVTNRNDSTTITSFIKTNGEAGYSTISFGNKKSIRLEQLNNKAAYLRPGITQFSDTQQLVITNTIGQALDHYRQLSTQRMPMESYTPKWIREAVILEVFLDYFKDGFAGLERKLPFYKDIGFNTVYLMPHWKGGYSPIDLYQVNSEYGSKESLQQLVKTAHSLGMKVLFDMVIHGFNRSSPVVRQHPSFFYRDSNDTLMIHPSWGSVMTDFMDSSYNRYMTDYVLYDQQTYGIDGYRVDAAAYKGPNWDRNILYPAYQSGSHSPQLIRTMLEALQKNNPEVTMLSEVFGPVFYTVSNFVHDNQTEALSFLVKEIDNNRYSISRYQNHLQHVYSALPKGAIRVFYSRNHDTSWFADFFGYTSTFMSLEAIHAFFGVPEVFAGDPNYSFNPDDDTTTYTTYKKLFNARKKYPELVHGEIILKDVESGNANVFSGIRRSADHTSIVLVSGSKSTESVAVRLPEGITLPVTIKAEDVLTGKEIMASTDPVNGLKLTLRPHQVIILRF